MLLTVPKLPWTTILKEIVTVPESQLKIDVVFTVGVEDGEYFRNFIMNLSELYWRNHISIFNKNSFTENPSDSCVGVDMEEPKWMFLYVSFINAIEIYTGLLLDLTVMVKQSTENAEFKCWVSEYLWTTVTNQYYINEKIKKMLNYSENQKRREWGCGLD
jgi:hypothetical protein